MDPRTTAYLWEVFSFRGFPVDGAENFHSFVSSLGLGTALNYIGGDSPRDKVRDKIYTSTEAPPSFKLPLHQEMSFIKNFPKHIYFYCDIPAAVGGATILADARSVYKDINPVVREKFAEKQLNYISHYFRRAPLIELINKVQRGHKSWMEVFETDKKEEVEVRCYENEFGFRWHQNDWLEITQKCPAVNNHPITGDKVWFNQAHLYDYNPRLIGKFNYFAVKLVYYRKHTKMHEITFGDGSQIDRSDLYHVMDTLDKNTIEYPWQKGGLHCIG